MEKIVECIPNFSEGKRQDVIDAILHEVRSVPGVTLWFASSDEDYNRTCCGFIGSLEAVKTAAINASLKAAECIDMSRHKGAHPRVGAADVIPLVPLQGVTVGECVEIANEIARTLSEKLDMPTYLYSLAAASPARPTQAQIQSTQYEAMFEKIKEEGFAPDYGPRQMSVKHGASMIGVREQVISMNFTLAAEDVGIAKKIAASIRESSGGLKNIKAIGVKLENGLVQVSMDDVDYVKTPLYKPYELIKTEAVRYGTQVVESEIIGMVPRAALVDLARHYVKLNGNFGDDQIIEKRLYDYVSLKLQDRKSVV